MKRHWTPGPPRAAGLHWIRIEPPAGDAIVAGFNVEDDSAFGNGLIGFYSGVWCQVANILGLTHHIHLDEPSPSLEAPDAR